MADVTDEDRARAQHTIEGLTTGQHWEIVECLFDHGRREAFLDFKKALVATFAEALAAERAREAARWQEDSDRDAATLNAQANKIRGLRTLLTRVGGELRPHAPDHRQFRELVAAIDAALGAGLTTLFS